MTRWQKGVLITVALLLVGALTAVTTLYVLDAKAIANERENNYRRAFFSASDNIEDIKLKLEKLTIAKGVKTQNALLYDIWLDAELAASDFGELTAKDISSEKIIRFLNQLGDYCKYLATINTSGITHEQEQKLASLYSVMGSLRSSFEESTAKIVGGEELAAKITEGISLLGDGYEHFNNDSSVEYPEMIYDGPFSDGLAERSAKYLEGLAEIDADGAKAALAARFPGIENITLLSENNGTVPSYLLSFTSDGTECSATVTKAGGLIASYSSAAIPTDTVIDISSITEGAPALARDLGYDGLSVVWCTNQDSMVYVNLAFKSDGIIYYPDIVKLKFSGEDGKLLAMDAMGYLYNHTERTTPAEGFTLAEAKAKVSTLLEITSTRLVVIPTEWNAECPAYEFIGTYNGATYYVYISSETLEEIKVMKVVEENGGTLIA